MAQITSDVITQVISSLGVVGALVWYLYFNTTKTIPELVKQHSDTMERISNNFTTNLKEEREQRKSELELLKVWIKTEASCKFRETNYHQPTEKP
ncbi:MAG TPA: hypothetical protein DDZ51_12720 [Planctomycetaceae bacterium]|jgi:uncharacterized membrane protein|nr:hypothetical protein [Planctomycetaceae bacterium]